MIMDSKKILAVLALTVGIMTILHFASSFAYNENSIDAGFPLKYSVGYECAPDPSLPDAHLLGLGMCEEVNILFLLIDLIIVLAISYVLIFWLVMK